MYLLGKVALCKEIAHRLSSLGSCPPKALKSPEIQQKYGSRALLGTKSKNLKEGPEKVDEVLACKPGDLSSVPSIYVKSARCGGAHCGGEQFPPKVKL